MKTHRSLPLAPVLVLATQITFAFAGSTLATAQGALTPTPEPFFGETFVTKDGKIARRGDACRPPRTDKPGIVKVDACGRWYCGRADVKDLIEVRPDFATEQKCTWTLKGDVCRCVP